MISERRNPSRQPWLMQIKAYMGSIFSDIDIMEPTATTPSMKIIWCSIVPAPTIVTYIYFGAIVSGHVLLICILLSDFFASSHRAKLDEAQQKDILNEVAKRFYRFLVLLVVCKFMIVVIIATTLLVSRLIYDYSITDVGYIDSMLNTTWMAKYGVSESFYMSMRRPALIQAMALLKETLRAADAVGLTMTSYFFYRMADRSNVPFVLLLSRSRIFGRSYSDVVSLIGLMFINVIIVYIIHFYKQDPVVSPISVGLTRTHWMLIFFTLSLSMIREYAFVVLIVQSLSSLHKQLVRIKQNT